MTSYMMRTIATDRETILAVYEGGTYIELLEYRRGSLSHMVTGASFDAIHIGYSEDRTHPLTLEEFNSEIDEWISNGHIESSFYGYLDNKR